MSANREAVRERYARAARRMAEPGGGGCCGHGPGCDCGSYSEQDLQLIGLPESISLGCGNPIFRAALEPGEKVLDLGSGGGLDVLLSARRVGPSGHAFGVDMMDEMLALAEANRARAGVRNATFMKGTIEAVPLPAATVDVVISNCVINLAEDKGAVIREAFRVLRAGGRLAIADVVELEPLAPEVKRAPEAWAGCVAGAIPVEQYRHLLLAAGFAEPEIEIHTVTEVLEGGRIGSAYIRARKPSA